MLSKLNHEVPFAYAIALLALPDVVSAFVFQFRVVSEIALSLSLFQDPQLYSQLQAGLNENALPPLPQGLAS